MQFRAAVSVAAVSPGSAAGNYLAQFISDVTGQLDLTATYSAQGRKDGRGIAAYHPLMTTPLQFFAYAIRGRSSRRIETATYDDLAFRYVGADQHPDHHMIAWFRQQHSTAVAALFS